MDGKMRFAGAFQRSQKKIEENEKTLLTLRLATPYKPDINEGGAPLAQMSSPL
jgi:hypothetical protein